MGAAGPTRPNLPICGDRVTCYQQYRLAVDTAGTGFSDVVNRVYAQKKFQMTQWGIAMYDDDPWASLYPNFSGQRAHG